MIKKLNLMSNEKVLNSFAISLLRVRNGHNYFSPPELLPEIIYISKLISVDSHKSLPINTGEIIYLYLTFLTSPRFILSEYGQQILTTSKKEKSLAYQISYDFIFLIQERFHLSEIPYTLFSYAYACHIYQFLHFGWSGFKNTDLLMRSYSTSKQIMTRIQEELFEHYKLDESHYSNKESIVKNYQLILSQYRHLSEFEPAINIFLNTDLGIFYENIMKEQILGAFGFLYNLTVYTDYDQHHDAFDLIIATSKTPELDNNFEDNQIIYIKEYPTINEFDLIGKTIKTIVRTKRNRSDGIE